MYQYHLIRLGGTYLTDGGLVGGTRYISEISGLDKLKLDKRSIPVIALDGTLFEQFHSNKGLPVSISFETLDTITYDAIITIIRASRAASTNISLYINGSSGSYDLDVRCIDIDFPATALEAGLKNVKFNFIVAQSRNTLTPLAGSYTLTGQSVTFS